MPVETFDDLLKQPNAKLVGGFAWLIWNPSVKKGEAFGAWEVYQRRPRRRTTDLIISTRSKQAAIAAFCRAAGIEQEAEHG